MFQERKAAVALIKMGDQILLIKRKKIDGDPWSGHIALPGGHVEKNETIEQGVLREVREEVSLGYSEADIVAEMPPVNTVRVPDLWVYPVVINTASFDGAKAGPEIEELRVVNILDYRDSTETNFNSPAMDYDGWIVWGLTYRILKSYLNQQR